MCVRVYIDVCVYIYIRMHVCVYLFIYLIYIYHCSAIQENEKEFLRQHLLRNFEEPVNPLAIQLAVLIAKIAR